VSRLKNMNALTADTFFNGRIRVKQHRLGYRFSIDSVLLSERVKPTAGDTVLDLGTGCGIIPLLLAYRHPGIAVCGVEVQRELAELAVGNVIDNQMADRITILCQDVVSLRRDRLPGGVNLVVCNPPYRKVASGRINPNTQRAIARHELRVTLDDILKTAKHLLDVSGRFVVIYPVERATELLSKMHASALEPKQLTMIHSYRHSNATSMIVEGVRGGRPGITITPPLVLYQDDGKYTAEVEDMFHG
jgi:tRNA1Val (adenine37-N6)-methyltransferase